MLDSLRDARQQLEELRRQRATGNPELYRDLALYLQVLRDGLLNSVQQACFVVATEIHPDRYQAMDVDARLQLHRRLRRLVRRACSLLTVEQVAQLAAQQARERIANRRQRRQQWLEGLGAEVDSAGASAVDPPGSVRLALQPPIGLAAGNSPLIAGLPDDGEAHQDGEPDEQTEQELGNLEHLNSAALPAGLLEAFNAVVERMELETGLDSDTDHPDSATAETGKADVPTPWDQGQLPRDPRALLVWLDGFEEALGRRLRNLSHAINVELLRLGLSRSLLPLSLLEAACQGRLELQEAPANLIRLPVTGLDAVAVLLRPTDLEQLLPALRTCRGRWRQQRQEVRRMAELSRRLQRRIQVLEAEELWLQDIASPSTHPAS